MVVCECSGVAKVSCILPGRPSDFGLQMGKACYSCWTRPVIFVANKGMEGAGGVGRGAEENVFISSVSSLLFLFLFLPCPSLSSPLLSLPCLFSLWETTQNDPQWLICQHNQFLMIVVRVSSHLVSIEWY